MKQICNAVAFCIFLIPASNSSLIAQDSVSAMQDDAAESHQLQSVFGDDFAKDSRVDYKTDGDVSWKEGQLELTKGSSIGREVNGGDWIKIDL